MLKPAEISDGLTPIKLITTEDTRFFHCNIKTLNLIPSVMAAQKAKEAGCQECVFYRPGGRVTECAHSNVHILKDGVLYTAPHRSSDSSRHCQGPSDPYVQESGAYR